MTYALRRSGGMPPAADELLTVAADGSWTMHRTQAVGAVGTFAGTLDPAVVGRLAEPPADEAGVGAAGVGAAGGPPPAMTPDAQTERVDLDGRGLTLGVYDEPPDAWAEQVRILRDLLDELTEQPVAAIALVVSVDPPSARLEHSGSAALTIGPAPIHVAVTIWGADGAILTQSGAQIEAGEGSGRAEVGPGWRLPLAVGDWAPEPGQWLQVEVSLEVTDDAGRRPASISAMVEVGADA